MFFFFNIKGGGKIKRGRTLFFQQQSQPKFKKGMVVELTPKRKHVKVATTTREKPILVLLDDIKEAPPQSLEGKVFVI